MLEIQNKQHYDDTITFAKSVGLYEDPGDSNHTLSNRLRYLESFGRRTPVDEDRFRVRLMPDGAPRSFFFVVEQKSKEDSWEHFMSGGLLFHGRHDGHGSGAGPTFAVSLQPVTGWQIHT